MLIEVPSLVTALSFSLLVSLLFLLLPSFLLLYIPPLNPYAIFIQRPDTQTALEWYKATMAASLLSIHQAEEGLTSNFIGTNNIVSEAASPGVLSGVSVEEKQLYTPQGLESVKVYSNKVYSNSVLLLQVDTSSAKNDASSMLQQLQAEGNDEEVCHLWSHYQVDIWNWPSIPTSAA